MHGPTNGVYYSMSQKEEQFDLPVLYKGNEILMPSRFVQMGYTFKIFVQLDGQEVIFEPDEERNFRAVVMEGAAIAGVKSELLQAIVAALDNNFK